MFLKIKDAMKESQYSIKTKYILLIHFPEEPFFWVTAVPRGSVNSHNVKQLIPAEDKKLPSHTIPYT